MAKVLIVEDSNSQAAIISDIVREAGHEPLICGSLSKGMGHAIKTTQPDIVLLDLILLGPGGKVIADGFQLCRDIKKASNNSVGVIIISSKADDESAEWAELQGADAFLQKPFAIDDLVEVMNEVLAKKPGV